MEHIEYQNTIHAIEALSRLMETLVYQDKQHGVSFIDLRNDTELKLRELITKL